MTSLSKHFFRCCRILTTLVIATAIFGGCAVKTPMLTIQGMDTAFAPGAIVDTISARTISFEQLIKQLDAAQVIYVGERHTNANHHGIQLQIIQALVDHGRPISVGMEMFDHTYQGKLDQWSAGKLTWPDFLKQVHWYANWRFNDGLYKEIMMYVQARNLRLLGLNIPSHLPAKISIGGLDSLSEDERALLPDQIDTSNADHRAYVKKIYEMHHIKGRDDFEAFYTAQCTWEDAMAQVIADHLGNDTMVVLAGNGHIVRKFGIPDRAFARTQAPFRTVYLVSPEETITREYGDFIWVTPSGSSHP